MEEARLARQAVRNASLKRVRSISPPAVHRPAKTAKIEQDQVRDKPQNEIPSTSQRRPIQVIDLDSPSPPLKQKPTPSQTIPDTDTTDMTASSPLRFPHGVVKKTWAFGHARTGNEIKIEEVLEKTTLKSAVLSAFQWDTDWVMSKVDLSHTKLIFVMQAKETQLRQDMLKDTEHMRKILRLCFPPMDGQINCMHSKMMLLFHSTKLRIVVPSANLVKYDWGETGDMENSVFLIDLPRLPADQKPSQDSLSPFGRSLLLFLEKQGLDEDVRNGILSFDFSATNPYAFIHSLGGTSYGSEMHGTGFTGLSNAIRAHNLSTSLSLHLDFAASSIGSLNDTFLSTLHTAARGQPLPSSPPPKPASKKVQQMQHPQEATDPTMTTALHFNIYFPTSETVTTSTAGGAGTICLARDWFERPGFPRARFRDYRSVRTGLLSHNKLLYARGRSSAANSDSNSDSNHFNSNKGKVSVAGESDKAENIAWVYVGSANCSESAWGKRSWDRARKEWKIMCRNWECGVLVPVLDPAAAAAAVVIPVAADEVETESESEEQPKPIGEKETSRQKEVDGVERTESKGGGEEQSRKNEAAGEKQIKMVGGREGSEVVVVGMEVFSGIVDVPFEYPGQEYEGKEPWYFKEH